jgi:type IV pilus assembly protein PilM
MQIKKILQIIKPKAKSLIGIDINADSIRLVELSRFGSNYQVEACINIPLAASASDDLVSTTLKEVFAQTQIKTKNVAVALSHSAIIFKEIEIVPGLSNKEIEDFLQFNIEKYIGEPANNISFDYQIVETPRKSNEHITLRLITVRRERVEKCIKLLQASDLCPTVIDIDSYALERTIRRQFKATAGLVAIINIDAGAILIVVIDGEKMVYAHEDFTNRAEIQSVTQITTHLKSKLLRQPLEKIVLAGEKAALPGLKEAINAQFNVQTVIIDPFFGMRLSPSVSQESIQKIAPMMAISCGLALRVTDANGN